MERSDLDHGRSNNVTELRVYEVEKILALLLYQARSKLIHCINSVQGCIGEKAKSRMLVGQKSWDSKSKQRAMRQIT